ncbi:AraC family transcriptional regulator [Clostridium sp. OS1-26]|uniref:AraC family transcriptional regulator n=1 Tax=Clostridium sp. OS1-26 TaxID=3070681 RepID=UPI0027E07A13|nr:AraC family transcriptional regulator [Clostridium sp. OS1-26]WML33565.1 AraC family transcriptional regulator [Clostridium sp. OS1-26]
MDWLRSMQNAINYMEDNILDEINYDKIAQSAYSSTFHFQRMFSMLTGFTIGEYIRNRRLTLAAQELTCSNEKITDIAFKYGYETSEAFTKAFQRLHGVTPSAARKSGVKLKSFGRLSIQITMKGDKEMNYKIIEKESFKMFGKDFKTNVVDGKCYREIPEFWEKCVTEGTSAKIIKISGKPENGLLDAGILFAHNPEDGSMRYMIACDMPNTNIPEEFKVLEIPALTWAIFEVDGNRDEDIHEVWKRISSEWFPASNYEHADAPEMERYYGNRDADYRCEVWIPVIKKTY